MQTMRWESARRYYKAHLFEDLLGDWVVVRAWGGKFNRLGGTSTEQVGGVEEGRALLKQISAEREKRRYQLISAN
jgi:hypothetical protein